MARIPLTRVGTALLVCTFWFCPKLGWAGPAAKDQQPPPTEVPDIPDGRRSYAQSAFTKLRAGYNLAGPESMPQPSDSRGELGQERDLLVQRHYRHMAEVDAIADAAMRNHDIATAERAEALRRRDIQRFMLAMQNLKRTLLRKQAAIGP